MLRVRVRPSVPDRRRLVKRRDERREHRNEHIDRNDEDADLGRSADLMA